LGERVKGKISRRAVGSGEKFGQKTDPVVPFLGPPLPMGAQDRSLREAVGIRWTDSCLEIFMERQGKPGSGGNQKRGSA